MNIFVTGGSGFVGRRLINRLVKDGHAVSALSRTEESDSALIGQGATPVRGDLNNISAWEKALSDVAVVVHCAAPVEFWGPWQKFQLGIVAATRNLVAAAANQHVKRFVHLSSESVLQDDERSLEDIDEAFPFPEKPNSFYGLAKQMAERDLSTSSAPIEIIILRPTFVWGPESPALQQITQHAKAGGFIWVDGGKHPFEAVHVDNLVEAIVAALTRGKDRNVYFVTDGEHSTIREFFSEFFQSVGVPLPRRSLPLQLLKPASAFIEWIWSRFSIARKPPLTRFDLSFVSLPRRYILDKARIDLAYVPQISRAIGFSQLARASSTN